MRRGRLYHRRQERQGPLERAVPPPKHALHQRLAAALAGCHAAQRMTKRVRRRGARRKQPMPDTAGESLGGGLPHVPDTPNEKRRRLVLAACLIATFIAAVESTIVAT